MAASADEVAIRNECKEILEAAISKLPDRYRRVIVLRMGLEGHSRHTLADIAKKLGSNASTVRVAIIKAMRLLTAVLMASPAARQMIEDLMELEAESTGDPTRFIIPRVDRNGTNKGTNDGIDQADD